MIRRVAAIAFALLVALSGAKAADRTLVFAAASMKDAVESVAEAYRNETGQPVTVSYASSGTLARQIEAGAPADIYLAANPDWMNYLEERGLIEPDSRRNIAANVLVVVTGEGGSPATPKALLSAGRFAMGDPVHVPAGLYAKKALMDLGLWDQLRTQAAYGENVRVALAMAARGDVDYAIVYASDAAMRDDLKIAYEFAPDVENPIVYPVALTNSAGGQASAFYDFLLGKASDGALEPFGFLLPPAPGPDS
ncbi:molybdate ABC transporter substrate-binding protein [Hoeflea sp. TYP-13]|uniref:molybdate ABC transporter substrate-binding protein n=1 Tax=Hoeflea sp. TYP-13 TaxID=3230023 RepID=UPI0034C63B4B